MYFCMDFRPYDWKSICLCSLIETFIDGNQVNNKVITEYTATAVAFEGVEFSCKMLIKYNTTRGLQILESKAKPGRIVQQDCLLLFYSAIFQDFYFFPLFLLQASE